MLGEDTHSHIHIFFALVLSTHTLKLHECSGTFFVALILYENYLVVISGQCDKSVNFLGIHVKFIIGESQSSFEGGLELTRVQLLLTQDVKVPCLCPSPRIVENLVRTRVDVTGDQ